MEQIRKFLKHPVRSSGKLLTKSFLTLHLLISKVLDKNQAATLLEPLLHMDFRITTTSLAFPYKASFKTSGYRTIKPATGLRKIGASVFKLLVLARMAIHTTLVISPNMKWLGTGGSFAPDLVLYFGASSVAAAGVCSSVKFAKDAAEFSIVYNGVMDINQRFSRKNSHS